MVAIKSHEGDRFLAGEVSGFLAYLVFGSDLGLVSERARRVAKALVDDPGDPFQMVRLTNEDVASDPGRLADEANTIPLFGGRRAILLDAGARNVIPALEHHLSSGSPCPVVIEAGALKKDAPLRKLFERAKTAVAIECYPDDERDLARLIDAEAEAAGLRVDPDAKQMLQTLLGGDRMASRGEMAKLTLYAHGGGSITTDDVEAVVADASAQATDALIDATFTGDFVAIEQAGRRVIGTPAEAGVLLGAALRHATWLHRAKLDLMAGSSLDHVLASGIRVGVSFKRKSAVERQLKRASGEALGRAVMRLGEAIGKARLAPDLAQSLALRTLWAIAMSVRGREVAS